MITQRTQVGLEIKVALGEILAHVRSRLIFYAGLLMILLPIEFLPFASV